MRTINDPRQKRLFDPYQPLFSARVYQELLGGWQGLFRHSLLELMPVDDLKKHFHPDLGRPTKELYAMAGLILLKEFENWTDAQTRQAYLFRTDVQFALNLDQVKLDLSLRTYERYLRLFRQDDLAQKVMDTVTTTLSKMLELNVDKQRLDSTHVSSNMALFARTRLMGVTIKRFLTQVKRHAPESYASLPEKVRARYSPGEHQLFGKAGKDADSRSRLRLEVAEDLHLLVERFADDVAMRERTTYTLLVKVFQQQCEVAAGKVTVRAKTGGDCVQNPSDPEATYDGKKGPGYQVQLSETCHEDNDVQLIVSALPQTAVESDAKALTPVLEDLRKNDLLPKEMTADTAYGSDANVTAAAGARDPWVPRALRQACGHRIHQ